MLKSNVILINLLNYNAIMVSFIIDQIETDDIMII